MGKVIELTFVTINECSKKAIITENKISVNPNGIIYSICSKYSLPENLKNTHNYNEFATKIHLFTGEDIYVAESDKFVLEQRKNA